MLTCRRLLFLVIVFVGMAMLSSPATASPNLVLNGNFTSGTTNGLTGWNNAGATYAYATGWTYNVPSTGPWNWAVYAAGSPPAVALPASPGGGYAQSFSSENGFDTVSQSVATLVGAKYLVSFNYYVWNYNTSTDPVALYASLGGDTGFSLTTSQTPVFDTWLPVSFAVTASSASSLLTFTGEAYWMFASNVSVTQASALPEPGQALLLIPACLLALVGNLRPSD